MILKENEQQLLNQLKETLGNYKPEAEVDSVWENVESTLNVNKKSQVGYFTQAFFLKVITGLLMFITGMLFYLNFDLARQIDKRKKVADLLNAPSDVNELIIFAPKEETNIKRDNTTVATLKEEIPQPVVIEQKKVESKKKLSKNKAIPQETIVTDSQNFVPTFDSSVIEQKTSETDTQSTTKDVKAAKLSEEAPSDKIQLTKTNEASGGVLEKDSATERKVRKGSSNPFKKGKRYNIPLKKEKNK